MNKKDFYRAVAAKAGKTIKDTAAIADAMQDVIFETIPYEEVKIFDGITFLSKVREAKTGRNPRTGLPYHIGPKLMPRCRFSDGALAKVANAQPKTEEE